MLFVLTMKAILKIFMKVTNNSTPLNPSKQMNNKPFYSINILYPYHIINKHFPA